MRPRLRVLVRPTDTLANNDHVEEEAYRGEDGRSDDHPEGEERGEESEEFFFGGGDAGAEAVE